MNSLAQSLSLILCCILLSVSGCEAPSEPASGVELSEEVRLPVQRNPDIETSTSNQKLEECVVEPDELSRSARSENAPEMISIPIQLGPINVGSSVTVIAQLPVRGDCEVDLYCEFEHPTGLLYSSDGENVTSVVAKRAELREPVELPLGISWSDTLDSTLDRLCSSVSTK